MQTAAGRRLRRPSQAVTWGDNCDARGRALPHRAGRPHASHAPPADCDQFSDAELGGRTVDATAGLNVKRIMHLLYLNPNSILGTTGKILRQRGHVVFFCTTCADALELLRRQSFDAVVIEDEEENTEILEFTARAHQWQPATPVFVANDWGPELPIALEEFLKPGEILHVSSPASMYCETEIRS